MSGSNIYTDEELKQLKKIKATRFEIIDVMVAGGVPDKVGEIRVLNEVLNSADKMIVDTATIRLKQQDAANSAATLEMVAGLLKGARADKMKYTETGQTPELLKEHQEVTLVDGETDINPERLAIEDFAPPTYDTAQAGEI